MSHEARQVPSWLIFDVGQKMKHLRPLLFLVALTACGAQENRPPVVPLTTKERIQELEARVVSLEKIVGTLADELMVKTGRYMLKAGDTGMKVARKFDVPITELHRLNPGVNWSRLKVGQVLRVSEETPNKAPEPTPGPVTPRAPSGESK